MGNMTPAKLILRCYGNKREGQWVGICVDLNIAVQAEDVDELKRKMYDAIGSYLEAVIETDDKESIPELLTRRAPLQDFATYYLIRCLTAFRRFPHNFVFREALPIQLAANC